MDRLAQFKALSEDYLKYPKDRSNHFEEYLTFFNYDESPDTSKNLFYLSDIDLKGNFLLALDEFIHEMEYVETIDFSRFNILYRYEIRKNINMKHGLSRDLKRILGKVKFEYLKKAELDRLRILYRLSELSYLPINELQVQELRSMKEELQEYLISGWGEDWYKFFINRFVYGESVQNIAKSISISRQYIHRKFKKMWKDYCKWTSNK